MEINNKNRCKTSKTSTQSMLGIGEEIFNSLDTIRKYRYSCSLNEKCIDTHKFKLPIVCGFSFLYTLTRFFQHLNLSFNQKIEIMRLASVKEVAEEEFLNLSAMVRRGRHAV